MPSTDVSAFLALVSGRRGHFELESGHHGGLWLDLDPLFLDPARVAPFVERLAASLAPHGPELVCGPLLGGAFLAQLVAQALGVEFCFTERVPPAGGDGGGLFRAEYRLPPAFVPRVRGRRVAMVDDVMSAGSSLRATCATLQAHGAQPVAAGALLVLGTVGTAYFEERGVPVAAVARDTFDMWPPAGCPLCAAGVPMDEILVTPPAG
jgi:orotate phosphoribosyltransferase